MSIISIEGITKAYKDQPLFKDVSLGIEAGEKIGIVGLNGTGKSTLLKILAGVEEPDDGKIIMTNNLSISFLPQIPDFSEHMSITDYIMKDLPDIADGWNLQVSAESMLGTLGITDMSQDTATLSGGEKKKVSLVKSLILPSDVLLLDEPTNHLDTAMIMWLEDYLKNYKGTILMVTHDRYFLDKITDNILEIDNQRFYTYKTNYSGFLIEKDRRIEEMLASEAKRQNFLRTETEWVRRGAKARTTKQKARLQRYEAIKNIEAPKVRQENEMKMESIASRMGRKTIEIDGISKSFGDRTLLRPYTYTALRNDRIGIVGENGCGKSTFLKMIVGEVLPDSGSVSLGDTIRIGYFRQGMEELESLPQNEKVIDYVRDTAEYINTPSGKITASVMCDRFLFNDDKKYSFIEKLSGGEKRRLMLLKLLMSAPNVLILDEPTNDLDIATMTIFEDFITNFDGIVITVSHDRYFLDNIVDRILAFDGHGGVVQYDGNYTDYVNKSGFKPATLGGASGSKPGTSATSGLGSSDSLDDIDAKKEENKKNWKQHNAKLKFSYKEQKEFETIEEDIEKIETRISEIDELVVKAATDFVRLGELAKEKEELEAELEYKMERWEYLTDLDEKIKNQ